MYVVVEDGGGGGVGSGGGGSGGEDGCDWGGEGITGDIPGGEEFGG